MFVPPTSCASLFTPFSAVPQVPAQFTAAAASNLQNLVARNVYAGETSLLSATPAGGARSAASNQHTILHMVSIPGCIQLFVTVAQWQPGAPDAAVGGGGSHYGYGSGLLGHDDQGEQPHWGAGVQFVGPAGQGGGDDGSQQVGGVGGGAGIGSGGVDVPEGGVYSSAPAPAWLVEAVCRAVEQFVQQNAPAASEQGTAAGTAAVADTTSSFATHQGVSSAAAPADSPHQQQPANTRYHGPVLINVNGVMHRLVRNTSDPQADWVLQQCEPQDQTVAQSLTSAASLALHTPAALAPTVATHTPHSQLSVSQATAGGTGSATGGLWAAAPQQQRSPPPTPASARTFVRTVARGVAALQHEHDAAGGLFAPLTPDPAAAGSSSAGSPAAAPTAVLNLNTTCSPALTLPPGMWAWPLYLATTPGPGGDAAAAAADALVAVCGSSAALPLVSLHGLPGSSCRVVLASGGGDGGVLMDSRLPVEDGVVR